MLVNSLTWRPGAAVNIVRLSHCIIAESFCTVSLHLVVSARCLVGQTA